MPESRARSQKGAGYGYSVSSIRVRVTETASSEPQPNVLTNRRVDRSLATIMGMRPYLWCLLSATLLLPSCGGSRKSVDAPEQQSFQFGGHYDGLSPRQKEMLHEWVDRYNEITGQRLGPSALYEKLPLSTRTTFEAVTHALMSTELTGEDGQSLGTALDLVRLIETVHGQIRGEGGDHQFRI